MKILEVTMVKQPLTGAQIWKNHGLIVPYQDFCAHNVIFERLTENIVKIIKNDFGPVGHFTDAQLEEFTC